jgi:hypothetical protein
MLIVPIALVGAVAMLGSAQPSSTLDLAAQRPHVNGQMVVPDQAAAAQPARIALAQEESMPLTEEELTAGEQEPAVLETSPAEPALVSDSEAPDPVAPAEPAQPVAGAPTPTLDFSRALEAPSVQTAIAQFSGMSQLVPAIPGQQGQTNQGAPPALQTAAAATMSALTGR